MDLTNEQKYYSQKGKKYKTISQKGKDYWDMEITETRYHPEGYLWVEFRSMKNDCGDWIEDDGMALNNLILEVQDGRTVEIIE